MHSTAVKKKRPSPVGQTPFGSVSRLVLCPICGRSVHQLLATAHVESHFLEGGGQPDDGEEAGAAGVEPAAAHAAAHAAAESNEDRDENTAPLCPLLPASHPERGDGHAAAQCGDGGSLPSDEASWRSFPLQIMSGDPDACGLCYERFEPGARDRFMLWPCQHTRQCGPCALRIWQTPKHKRRCPWCATKLDTRPRAFRPYM